MSRRRYFEEQRYRYDGMRDLINNADEDVDCITSATESSIYHNDSFIYLCKL